MLRWKFKTLCVLLILGFKAVPVQAQPSALEDTSQTVLAPPQFPADSDSVLVESFSADSTRANGGDLDTTVVYSAQSIEFFVPERRTILRGNAVVHYQGMTLQAEQIILDWNERLITAIGTQETLWADSLRAKVDTIIVRGAPQFTEGDQTISGDCMVYNLTTRRGRISGGSTNYQDGAYWGAAIKKDTSNVLYVGLGSFTTCDAERAHYSFRSKQMKLLVNDKVVAKPVELYIGEVPIGIVPFGVFPSKSGRQSGIIIPTYGESASQGRFIRHLGYYWAPNDYSDFLSSLDYYERSGFLLGGRARYNWRYHLAGTVEGAYIRQHFAEQRRRRWEVKFDHNQQITPDTRLQVNGNVISDGSYYQDYSFNLNEQLSQILRSDATLTHTFPGGKNSFSANVHHEQNLLNDEITQNLPRLTFRRSQTAFIPAPQKAPGDTSAPESRWYHNLYYSYTSEALHRRVLDRVTSGSNSLLLQERRSAAKHTLNFNSPQKVWTYLSLTPSLNYNEQWFDEYKDYTNTPVGEKVNGFRARRTFNTSLGFTTKLYGYWLNPLSSVEAIRHTATPTLSLNFQPDFSDPEWGYYQHYTDTTGVAQKKDRFAGSLYGSTPQGKTFAIAFQLSNLFQMKYGSGEEKKKRDLFTADLYTNYNFAADSLRFAPLTTSFRATPISSGQPVGPLKMLSLDLSTYHSFYKFGGVSEYDEYYFDPKRGKFLRLRSLDISANSNFSLGTLVHAPETARYDEDQAPPEVGLTPTLESAAPRPPAVVEQPRDWYLGQSPWDLQLSWHYTINRYNPNNPTKTFWMNASVDASITRNWQVSYNTRVDLEAHKVVSAGLTIYRDLHCWEARFIWNPLGIGQGYYLKISLKSPQLRDVKLERRRGQGTFMGF